MPSDLHSCAHSSGCQGNRSRFTLGIFPFPPAYEWCILLLGIYPGGIGLFSPIDPAVGQPLGFLALGLLMAFNPCMLAMGPTAAAYLGRSPSGGVLVGVRLGLAFVAGYSLTLALLGTILTSLGHLAASLVSWWPYLLAGLYWALGLYFLRHWLNLSPPIKVSVFYCRRHRVRLPGSSLPGAFFGGLALGVIPSPCATPVVLATSAYFTPAQQSNLVALNLFFFGLGHSLPLFLASFLTGYLKAGRWARFVNPALGFLLLALGFYFLWQGPTLFTAPVNHPAHLA